MPPNSKRRPARDRATLGVFNNSSNAPRFNPALGRPQETAEFERLADLRFCRAVERVHALGPRVLAELLAEIGARHLIRTDIEQVVERYAELDPDTLRRLGADRFPPPPLRLAAGSDR